MATHRHITLTALWAIVLWQIVAPVGADGPPSFVVVPMEWGQPEDINDNGMTVGVWSLQTAAIWQLSNGGWEWFCCMEQAHVWSWAFAVNELNQATGSYENTF